MTENNAWPSKSVPLIKAASFTTLTEAEIASMRSFIKPNDSRIVTNEVFFLAQNKFNDIEGDDFATSHKHSASCPNLGLNSARRKYEVGSTIGSSTTVAKSLIVMWNNHTISPAATQQIILSGGAI